MVEIFVSLKIGSFSSVDSVWDELIALGLEPLYSVEEDGEQTIYIKAEETSSLKELLRNCSSVTSVGEPIRNETNWQEQWAIHAPGFTDGHAVIDLEPFGSQGTIYLDPGAGFGDLSHPTTHLMLSLMAGVVAGQDVVDIGSGSGVLSLAAVKMGAHSVIGSEIDSAALAHSKANSSKNGLDLLFVTPELLNEVLSQRSGRFVGLMNMIWSEQKEAYRALECKGSFSKWIVSGILLEEREAYLRYCHELGWRLERELVREGWLAFHFSLR